MTERKIILDKLKKVATSIDRLIEYPDGSIDFNDLCFIFNKEEKLVECFSDTDF